MSISIFCSTIYSEFTFSKKLNLHTVSTNLEQHLPFSKPGVIYSNIAMKRSAKTILMILIQLYHRACITAILNNEFYFFLL